MLGFDRRAAKAAWTIALVAIALLAVYSIRKTLFIFLLAVFFSYMVYPAIKRVDAFTPRRLSRTAAAAAVFALIVLAVAGFFAVIGPPIADEASRLSTELPALVSDPSLMHRLPLPEWATPYVDRTVSWVQREFASGTSFALPLAQRIGRTALGVASNLIYVVLIPILSFLLIKDASGMRTAFLARMANTGHLTMWQRIVDGLDKLLGGYIRSLLILSGATLTVYSIFFSIAKVPYSLLLAGLAAVLEFIPVIGPLAAAVVAVTVSALAGYDSVLLLIGFIVLYRLFQDYVLNPYLMSGGVEVPPLLVLFGLLAGEEIGGVVGIFLSVPTLAAARIITAAIIAEVSDRRVPKQPAV